MCIDLSTLIDFNNITKCQIYSPSGRVQHFQSMIPLFADVIQLILHVEGSVSAIGELCLSRFEKTLFFMGWWEWKIFGISKKKKSHGVSVNNQGEKSRLEFCKRCSGSWAFVVFRVSLSNDWVAIFQKPFIPARTVISCSPLCKQESFSPGARCFSPARHRTGKQRLLLPAYACRTTRFFIPQWRKV